MVRTSLLLLIMIMATAACAQQGWQWGKRGGGSADNAVISTGEDIVDMATDNAGNVYALAHINSDGFPTLDGAGTVSGANTYTTFVDLLVFSYDCRGNFRWKKVIGGYAGSDRGIALGVDTLGHVYICGSVQQPAQYPFPLNQPLPVHFGTDSIQPFSNRKSLFVVQYDTAGSLKWIRWPAPDTASGSRIFSYMCKDMIVGRDGRVDLLCLFPKSLIGNANGGTAVADTAGNYILSYNAQGTLTGLVKPQLGYIVSTPLINIRMARTTGGKYIVSGVQDFPPPGYPAVDTLVMGGQKVANTAFVACYNSQWQLLWKRENTNGLSSQDGFFYRPVTDNSGNIFLVGNFFPNNCSFNGTPLVNSLGPYQAPYIVKLDSLGNNRWLKCSASTASNKGSALALSGTGRAYITGYQAMIQWGSYTLWGMVNRLYDVYLASFDTATGTVLGIDSLKSSFGYNEYASAMAADSKGNVYIGGNMQYDLTVNGTTLYTEGGSYDFFIAKYGTANCGTALPLKIINYELEIINGSVLHHWQTANEINVSHFNIQYSSNGRDFYTIPPLGGGGAIAAKNQERNDYNALSSIPPLGGGGFYRLECVDKDGKVTYSKVVFVPFTIHHSPFTIYPNPAKDIITISYSKIKEVRIVDIAGRVVVTKAFSAMDNIQMGITSLKKGLYLVKVIGAGDAVQTQKLMVE